MEPVGYAVIGSVLAAAGSFYAVIISRRKVVADAKKAEAEAESVNIATAGDLVESIRKQLTYMDGEVKRMQDTLSLMRARVMQLEQYILSHGLPLP